MALMRNDIYFEIGLILKENVIFRKVGCKPLIYARACACVVFDVVVGRDRCNAPIFRVLIKYN